MRKPELRPDMYVLDSLANDVEDLETILRLLNGDTELAWRDEWGREFQRSEVVEAVSRLIRRNAVRAYAISSEGKSLHALPERTLPSGDYGDAYFGLTPQGRMLHRDWCAEDEDGGCG
jgi:hypothetical protein